MLISFYLLWIAIITIFLYGVKFILQQSRIVYYLQKLPGPKKDNLILGNTKCLLLSSPEEIFAIASKWSEKYYPIYKCWSMNFHLAILSSPEDFELILTDMNHIKKSKFYELLYGWLNTGLLTSWGRKWHVRRKMLTPAFHFNILQQFVPLFNCETDKLVEILKKECDKPYVNVTGHINHFALRTITETAMGYKIDEANSEMGCDYKTALAKLGRIVTYRFFRFWLLIKFVYFFTPIYFKERYFLSKLHRFTDRVIAKRQEDFRPVATSNNNNDFYRKRRLAMLDLLLSVKQEQGAIDNRGIREEVDTFVFEGHDTTAMAMMFSMMMIANHKQVQDRLLDEMHGVLGDLHAKPTFGHLQELKYMEMVIKEVLRLYPSVLQISRKLGKDLITHSGYLLPKDSTVLLYVIGMHRNPNVYPNPEKFDPDRFLPENCQNRHPFAFVPFSAGPRNCIGQKFAMLEIKAFLCGILANFILEPIDTPETIILAVDMILRATNGVKVKLIPRNN